LRPAFITSLIEEARRNENIYLLVAEVGFGLVEPFAEEFPRRFVNTGIAEQNMIGIATGLGLSGKTVFAYSIANFPTARCIEQIRNDICYHNVSVKIVASGGGLIYGSLGTTHHVTQDVALMRALPNMTVVAPGDPVEAALATKAAIGLAGPVYLRLGRTADPKVHQTAPNFQIGKAIKVREGSDVTLIASGGMLFNAFHAAEQLASQGIESRVLSMHTVKPLDVEAVGAAVRETGAVITVEEHSVLGGLGSTVAEIIAEGGIAVPFKIMGIPDEYCSQVGSRDYLLDLYSLSINGITSTIKRLIER